MTDLRPRLKTTRYDVSCLPESHPDRHAYTLLVEYRGRGKWCVRDDVGFCYDRDGNRSYESLPTNRTCEYLERHRFSMLDALMLAKQLAPLIVRSGMSVEQVAAFYDEQDEDDR